MHITLDLRLNIEDGQVIVDLDSIETYNTGIDVNLVFKAIRDDIEQILENRSNIPNKAKEDLTEQIYDKIIENYQKEQREARADYF